MKKMLKSEYFDVLLSAIIVLVIVAYILYQNFTTQQVIVLYILDSDMKATNYPHTLLLGVNDTATFYVGVENKLQRDAEVVLKVKLVSNRSWARGSEPCPARPILGIPMVLMRGGSRLIFLKISLADALVEDGEGIINKVDVNGKEVPVYLVVEEDDYLSIVVELWLRGVFTGQWVELKLHLKPGGL